MMKVKAYALLVLSLFSSSLFNVHAAQVYGTIYIRANGSIDPLNAPISSLDNVLYRFDDNVVGEIVLERNNIILDGMGYSLKRNSQVEYASGILLRYVNNTKIRNLTITGFNMGIQMHNTDWCCNNHTISNCTLVDNIHALYLEETRDCNIFYNNITNNNVAISIICSFSINVSGNSITNNNRAIGFSYSSSQNKIFKNLIESNNEAFSFWLAGSNLISRNDVFNNKVIIDCGRMSNGNKFFHNNFIGNTIDAWLCDYWQASWDDGYPSGGNYWSNYSGVDLNHDGIGDTEQGIDENDTDRYPLMGMFSSFNTSLGYGVDVVSNSTMEDFEYSNSTIKIHVSNKTVDQTYGFCRLTILHNLMSPPYNVTINDNPVTYNTVFENETLSIIYFNHELSTLEVIIIPEFPTFLILPLFLIAALLSVTAYRMRKAKTK